MAKFRNFILKLEKKKNFKLPVVMINSDVHKEYESLVKQGYLKKAVKQTIESVDYLVYNRTKKAEAYFKQSKRKEVLWWQIFLQILEKVNRILMLEE